MFLHISFHRPPRRCPVSLATGSGQRAIGFQRKFGIDADRAGRCRHVEETIHPPPIGKCVLETEGVFGKRVADQIFQLHLAETATRLLVRQDVLQRANLPRQLRDMGVRLFDDGKFLGHAGERAVGAVILVAKRVFKAGAKPALGLLHLRGDGSVKIAGLRGKLGKLALQLGKVLAVMPASPLAHQHEDENGDDDERQEDDHHVEWHGREIRLQSGP